MPGLDLFGKASAKAHIDTALGHLRTIGHEIHHTPATYRLRWLIEFAASFLREAWLDADGQTARSPEDLCKACVGAKALFDSGFRAATAEPDWRSLCLALLTSHESGSHAEASRACAAARTAIAGEGRSVAR